jgi:hypothetical protein
VTRVTAVVALAALAPAAALAFPNNPIRLKEFDHSGTLLAGGRQLQVGGPLACWKDGTVKLHATISERSTRTQTGALAQGVWTGTCTGNTQRWHLRLRAANGARFRAGCAQADGLAVYSHGGEIIDFRQWLQTITLTAVGKAATTEATC